jgi:hypothetical protein
MEDPMPLDALAAPLAADPCFPGETARPAIRAITAAEVVFHEDEVDAEILAHVPRSVLVEPIAADAVAKDLGIDRARKLAAEGWRVVWLVAGDPAPPAADFAEAGIVESGAEFSARATRIFVVAGAYQPHLLATALNGLAG